MIILSKILPLFILPVGITLILIGAGLVLRRRALLIAAGVVLWGCSMPIVSGRLSRMIEGGAVRVPADSVAVADAIVVLSTGRATAPGPEAVSEWQDADRFFGGLELLEAGRAPVIVFTGGAVIGQPGEALEGDVLGAQARAMGVPAERILTTGTIFNTAEEAAAVSALMKQRQPGNPRIILVTSAFHMPRAQRRFEQAGLSVTAFPVDFAGSSAGGMGVLGVLPTAIALADTQSALREFYGRAYYRLKPW